MSKGDIVKALEFLKCLFVKDLIFREPAPTSAFEDELEVEDDDGNLDWDDKHDMHTWNNFVIDSEDDNDK
jgi:hypothetical protein